MRYVVFRELNRVSYPRRQDDREFRTILGLCGFTKAHFSRVRHRFRANKFVEFLFCEKAKLQRCFAKA